MSQIIQGLASEILNNNFAEGNLLYTTDTEKVYIDMPNNIRKEISFVKFVKNERIRLSLITPLTDHLYIVLSTGLSYVYHNGEWIKLGGFDKLNKMIGDTRRDVSIISNRLNKVGKLINLKEVKTNITLENQCNYTATFYKHCILYLPTPKDDEYGLIRAEIAINTDMGVTLDYKTNVHIHFGSQGVYTFEAKYSKYLDKWLVDFTKIG
jgi:hypothetical protein